VSTDKHSQASRWAAKSKRPSGILRRAARTERCKHHETCVEFEVWRIPANHLTAPKPDWLQGLGVIEVCR
jgi:hypothetical protein